ncbi:VOC family protein [Aestuariivita sp.]|uniref:VOC family protein n=1 Tax=Aestuariivita sp. TaxID=1872407 RepID=UPI00216F884E|nr:VOC family protein [Aestuariivita sp.]MCE8009400.1 VOC family protein [Aestuariivita sp.]
MRKSVDHTVTLVRDLVAASETMRRLGFNVRPIAHHIGVGSANAIIHFPETYHELVYTLGARSDIAALYMPRLEDGEGLCHISLTSDDLRAETLRLLSEGFRPGDILQFSRDVIMPDGSFDQTASASLYNWHPVRQYVSLFFSEHPKPETIFIPEYADHANGAQRLTRLSLMSTDPVADRSYFERSFGHAADTADETGFCMRGGRGDICAVMSPEAAMSEYGDLLMVAVPVHTGGFPVAHHYQVADMDDTRAYLADAGIETRPHGPGVAVAGRDAVGSVLVLEPA